MSDQIRALVAVHWDLANARNWADFANLLHRDMKYEVPQTREYIECAAGYLDMFRTWPGDWRAEIQSLICDSTKAVSIIEFKVGSERMTGISVFEAAAGLIEKVTDYWPEAYEPPPRQTPWLKRRPMDIQRPPTL